MTGCESAIATSAALGNRLRPDSLLKEILAQDTRLEFVPMEKLDWVAGQSPLNVTVVLYTLPDERTERRWQDAGLFASPDGGANPFLRIARITAPAQFDALRNWRVEGVLREAVRVSSAR